MFSLRSTLNSTHLTCNCLKLELFSQKFLFNQRPYTYSLLQRCYMWNKTIAQMEFKKKIIQREDIGQLYNHFRISTRLVHNLKSVTHTASGRHLNAKNNLDSIYGIVKNELKQKDLYNYSFRKEVREKKLFHKCILSVNWPEPRIFTHADTTKALALKKVASECMEWLQQLQRLKNGRPVIYQENEIKNILNKPVGLNLNPNVLLEMNTIINTYNEDIKNLVAEENLKIALTKKSNKTVPLRNFNEDTWNVSKYIERNEHLLQRLQCRKIGEQSRFPITKFKNTIIQMIARNQIVLIKGDTGCGKTTQVPQYILDYYTHNKSAVDCNILISQPRKISAISLAERIANERGEFIGDVVGYQVRLRQKIPQAPGSMLFCTTGVLLKKLQYDPNLQNYSHIIIDEAHERSIEIDMLMALMKRVLERNPRLKLIIMSATINTDLFQTYFNCAVIEVPGKTYPVQMHFLDEIYKFNHKLAKKPDSLSLETGHLRVDCEYVTNLIKWISNTQNEGAILCFLPGWAEISTVLFLLKQDNIDQNKLKILTIHSKISPEEQRLIFEKAPEGMRKIILATDIAETGITVSDVVYVVDCALRKQLGWYEDRGLPALENQYVSKANLLQRKGRAGRVKPGHSYHLITRRQYEDLETFPIPEIMRTSLEKTVMSAKLHSSEKAETFFSSMPQPPSRNMVKKAVKSLIQIGVFDNEENLTPLGERIVGFTLHPKWSKAIIYSTIFNCVYPTLTTISLSATDREIFYDALRSKSKIREVKKIYHPFSDHMSLCWLYFQWEKLQGQQSNSSKSFCVNSKLNFPVLLMLLKERELLAKELHNSAMLDDTQKYFDMRQCVNDNSANDELVLGVLLSGMDQVLYQPGISFKKGTALKSNRVLLAEDRTRATLTLDSVNSKREYWPSPYLMYFSSIHCRQRRMMVVRESSMLTPLTVFLFSQTDPQIKNERIEKNNGNYNSQNVIITFEDKMTVRIQCNKESANTLLQFRKIMWTIVDYFVLREGKSEFRYSNEFATIEKFRNELMRTVSRALESVSVCEDLDDSFKDTERSD